MAMAGCAVPQPRGTGQLERIVEPETGRAYWRYLPEEYLAASEAERATRSWPLVMTFHGMVPFDGAHAQAREWEAEADRYGFIVVAPQVRSLGVLSQFPLRTVHPAFKRDEEAMLAVLDHVQATTSADARHVLATSFSSGGYVAHYMLNRHPQRFSCLGVRQSNFSKTVLDASATADSRHHPVLIINTQNDFAICKRESEQAVQWYESHGYSNLSWYHIKKLGHERTPELAAAFFGKLAGVAPQAPSIALARHQVLIGAPQGMTPFGLMFSPDS